MEKPVFDYIMPETVCDAINDMRDPKGSMAIINYINALTARIADLEADLEATRRERDKYLDEIIHLENGESV